MQQDSRCGCDFGRGLINFFIDFLDKSKSYKLQLGGDPRVPGQKNFMVPIKVGLIVAGQVIVVSYDFLTFSHNLYFVSNNTNKTIYLTRR